MRRPSWVAVIGLFIALGIGTWVNSNNIDTLTDNLRNETKRALTASCRDSQRSHDAAVALASQVYAPFNPTSVSGQTSIALLHSLGLAEEQISLAIKVGNDQKAADLARFEQTIGPRPNCTKDQLSSIVRVADGN